MQLEAIEQKLQDLVHNLHYEHLLDQEWRLDALKMLHQSQLILIERREAEEDVGFKRFTFLPLYIIDGLKYVVNYDCKVMFNKAITKSDRFLFILPYQIIFCKKYGHS